MQQLRILWKILFVIPAKAGIPLSLLHFATNEILNKRIVIVKSLVKSISYMDYTLWHGKCNICVMLIFKIPLNPPFTKGEIKFLYPPL
jgi:hypothetical protein